MKKYIFPLLLSGLILLGCKGKTNEEADTQEPIGQIESIKPINGQVLEHAVIYEANIRQYSPEGTFDAFTADIPKLKDLGVKIIWLMPIHPISMAKRKAKGDLLVADIEDPEERKKYLGSPYAVADYSKVNPDLGTMEDFTELVETAHANGMYVILDWVPNHTGWDHHWITEHPEYYTKNKDGEITDPIQDNGEPWGWTDVADLNYDNQEMRQAMMNEMLFWVTEQNIDGFRCDVAHGVPLDFWEDAIPKLRYEKPIFMLAEAEIPALMQGDELFDMSYAWEGHHVLNQIAQGEKDVRAFDSYMDSLKVKLEPNDILMNFVTNHDENAWAGPLRERMGAAAETMTALTYLMPGMPLIYSGQEYDMNRTLNFFGKDSIPKTKRVMWPLLQELGELKNTNPALKGGKDAASYERLETSMDDKVLAFKRGTGENEVVFIANLSGESVNVQFMLSGDFKNYQTDANFSITENQEYGLEPWEYWILTK